MEISQISYSLHIIVTAAILTLLSACTSLVNSATATMATNLSSAILNSDDPQTVADGAPAYLLLLDSMLRNKPDKPQLLRSAATLYSAYARVFVKDKRRVQRMSKHALGYAIRAVCVENKAACHLHQMNFTDYQALLDTLSQEDVPGWYILGVAWAGWIDANRQDWSTMAELPRVEAIMDRLATLDGSFKQGGPHLYLGILSTLLPPALGGKPAMGRRHFEKADSIAKGKNLIIKVMFAEKYARLVFDQDLHDALLNEVISANPIVPDLTLMNILAQQRARELLATGQDYF
ncbi:MAG TPA: hypothetical protein ENI80_02000 [Acidiferrobacteraceae bacterium]|nr:hypothetical protein [Acidiferrobacteraceae bacterium]